MNFFKSMLSDDPEPENMDDRGKSETDRRPNQSPKHQGTERAEDEHMNLSSTSSGDVDSGGGGLWSFGDLVKTLTTRSESVLETYRRDLKEFGSGLRKESDLFREVASRAVKELPSSIEVGASAIDGVLKSTADIISQGKDALLEPSDIDDSDASEAIQNHSDRSSLNSRVYSRFDSQLNAIQNDARTYCEDPEDLDDYNKWKSGFVLIDSGSEIEKLIGDKGSVETIYRKVVPNEVDDVSFWCRYFYRVQKLKQQEDRRASLVRRSLTVDDEEDLSWDVDDEEEEDDLTEIEKKQSSNDESITVSSIVTDDDLEKNTHAAIVNKNIAEETNPQDGYVSDGKDQLVQKSDEDLDCSKNAGKDGVDESKTGSSNASKEKVESVPKTNQNPNAGKNGDVADEDLEWDEIGDLGENDEKEVSQGGTAKKADVFNRLNTGDDDEDLNWDIEEDDEPVKTSNSK
ncbi:hypothetical protein L1887_21283 [Cichorium endivia]|nr:hypothetical protein L1887_21283 [Cichorium endivia]